MRLPPTGDRTPEPKINSANDSDVKLPGTVEVKDVDPKILLSRQNSTEMSRSDVKDLMNEMKKEGYQYDPKKEGPVSVGVYNGKYIIIDGHHRVEAAKKPRFDKINIELIHLDKKAGDELLRQVAEARSRY